MDQKKIGLFLRSLRKENGLTQEQLAEQFNVSGRTVSRWETGTNMPDLSVLVEMSDYYQVDIKEILDGERKSKPVHDAEKDTLIKVAEYTEKEKQTQQQRMRSIIGGILMGFGIFTAISALAVFPRDSSWGSIYSVIGVMVLSAGVHQLLYRHHHRFLCAIGCFLLMLSMLLFTDYLGVIFGNQVPRFAYAKEWGDDCIAYKAPFYQVLRYNHDTENEYIEVVR